MKTIPSIASALNFFKHRQEGLGSNMFGEISMPRYLKGKEARGRLKILQILFDACLLNQDGKKKFEIYYD